VTVDEYICAYLEDIDEWWWTTSLSTEPEEMVLPRMLATIDRAGVAVHQKALGQLGAGPLEDMMSDRLLDELQAFQPFSPALKLALSCVRIEAEPASVRNRLAAMFMSRLRTGLDHCFFVTQMRQKETLALRDTPSDWGPEAVCPLMVTSSRR
jgi:hypothetical protein